MLGPGKSSGSCGPRSTDEGSSQYDDLHQMRPKGAHWWTPEQQAARAKLKAALDAIRRHHDAEKANG